MSHVPIDSSPEARKTKPYKEEIYSAIGCFRVSVTHPFDLFMISSTRVSTKIEPTPFPQHVIIEDNLGLYIAI